MERQIQAAIVKADIAAEAMLSFAGKWTLPLILIILIVVIVYICILLKHLGGDE